MASVINGFGISLKYLDISYLLRCEPKHLAATLSWCSSDCYIGGHLLSQLRFTDNWQIPELRGRMDWIIMNLWGILSQLQRNHNIILTTISGGFDINDFTSQKFIHPPTQKFCDQVGWGVIKFHIFLKHCPGGQENYFPLFDTFSGLPP